MHRIPSFYIIVLLMITILIAGCSGGGGSNETVFPSHSSIPSEPMAMSAVGGDGSVTLGWNAVASASLYNIYRSESAGAGIRGTKIASIRLTSYNDTSVSNGTTYYYVVTAMNSAGEGAYSSEVSATPFMISGPITISGTVLYQDKEYDDNGFTGNMPYKAVRYASVELINSNGVPTGLTGQTDGNGVYSISTTTASSNVYVRVKAEATPPGSVSSITIKDLSASVSIYSVRGNDFIPAGPAIVNLSIPTTSIGGAFNILDVFTTGFLFDHALSGSYPPNLVGYWQKNNQYGTYYCSGGCSPGNGIYVLNYSGDTDEYDDDVLYHEFGHFTADYYSQDDSMGGTHYLTDNDIDMRLTWSEGWGDAMPGNIKLWLDSTAPELLSSSGVPLTEYVDTNGTGAGIALDMGDPDHAYGGIYGPPDHYYFYYASSEIAVAKILLELHKNFGMQPVWDVFDSFTASNSPVNLETFWDQWGVLSEPTTTAGSVTIKSLFLDRSVKYSLDYFEGDDSIATASTYTFGQPQVHTLYGAGDADYVAFNAILGTHYTITTSDLLNGADTLMTLMDSDGTTTTIGTTPANPSDNANGTIYSGTLNDPSVPSDVYSSLCDSYGVCHDNGYDILGSRLEFTAATSDTYYLKIQSSPKRPVSAGHYGTYTLTITQQ